MCGIAGALTAEPDPEVGLLVAAVTDGLAHRGPDGEGFWRSGPDGSGLSARKELERPSSVILGHRRLSIVDIEGGAQPMSNEDGTVWVSYNGEIYNQLELRTELERAGHRFGTNADTEVLVHGWEEWREGLFGRLNGIFAFSLVDERSGEVVVVRDPLGVKPVYVGVRAGRAWWSSELAACVAAGLAKPIVSGDALKLFFTFRFIPSPYAVFQDVWKVPPGHFVRVRELIGAGEPRFYRYTTEIRSTADPKRCADWREALSMEITSAIERQLMADVPVASLLSGGVDSSLVTQVMAAALPYEPQTFGAGFRSDGESSEAVVAAGAARELGVPHTSVVLADHEYVREWPHAIERISEPVANSGGLLLGLLCKEVAKTHKVVLTGQGADEPLGGYPRHVVERIRGAAAWSPRLSVALARGLRGADDAGRLERALAAPTVVDRYVEMLSVVPPELVDGIVRTASTSARELARTVIERWEHDDAGDPLNGFLRVDARLSLADDLLLIADHFSMRSSVELRVPFLDLRLIELLERMPSRYKISPFGGRKWLYRRAAASVLPPEIARRECGMRARFGPKRGFSTPLGAWFDSADGPLADPSQWIGSIQKLDGVALASAAELAPGGRLGAFARQRAAFYSLAMWANGATGRGVVA